MLLDPEDMESCHSPDRLSILTYVSEYYHKFKNSQPKGSPMILSSKPLKRQDSTDSAGMPLSRTPSSSGASSSPPSTASSCDSSSSSICDSPPPQGVASGKSKEADTGNDGKVNSSSLVKEEEKSKNKENEDQSEFKVVVRRRERSLASRRLVQSMFLESTGGISSLVNSSSESPSPEIEQENPFREAMIKFANLEEQKKKQLPSSKRTSSNRTSTAEEPKQSPSRKTSSSKSTKAFSPSKDSKSTQTSGVVRRPRSTVSPFKSVLQTQLSTPVQAYQTMSSSMTTSMTGGLIGNPRSGGLSYTSTPKPYSGQIGRSSSMGQSLNSMSLSTPQHISDDFSRMPIDNNNSNSYQNIMSSSYHGGISSSHMMQNEQDRRQCKPVQKQQQLVERRHHKTSASSSRRPSSMHISHSSLNFSGSAMTVASKPPAQQNQPMYQSNQDQQLQKRPLIWHTSLYSSSPSLYARQAARDKSVGNNNSDQCNGSNVQSHQPGFMYKPQLSGGVNSPLSASTAAPGERHLMSPYNSQDRFKLHIEGQSSLV